MNETGEAAALAEDDLPALSPERLPPQARKHVDPKAPVPLRMMGAKGLVPVTPPDACYMVALLAQDPDPSVAETALATSSGLPDKVLSVALREEAMNPRVLDFLAQRLEGKDNYLELIILNNATPDFTVARIASTASQRLAEIAAQNQMRLLRHDAILRALCGNPNAQGALIDGVCDFAVRSGLVMDELEPMKAARIRVFGEKAPPAPSEEEKTKLAEEILQAVAEEQRTAGTESVEAKTRAGGAWNRMTVVAKVRKASFGEPAFRILGLRDPNRMVAMAAVTSPRMTDNEIEIVARSRAVHPDVLRFVYENREWTKGYPIKLALVRNPKVPMPVANRFLQLLRESDQRLILNDRNVPAGVRNQAKALLSTKQREPQKK